MWIIVELDCYNDCGIRAFSGVIGPFSTVEAANKRCEELEKRNLYATEFEVVEVNKTKHFSDDQPY